MRLTCNISLPKDRTLLGQFNVVDENGEHILGPFPCLGLCDHGAAAAQGNPTCDPLKPYGNTPVGLYGVKLIPPGGDAHSYGPYRRIALTPISGPCCSADRDGLDTGAPPNSRMRADEKRQSAKRADQAELGGWGHGEYHRGRRYTNIFMNANQPTFEDRVADAKLRLLDGESPAEIRQDHGLIVLQAAREQMEPAYKMTRRCGYAGA